MLEQSIRMEIINLNLLISRNKGYKWNNTMEPDAGKDR